MMRVILIFLLVGLVIFGCWELLIYAVNSTVCDKNGRHITCHLQDLRRFSSNFDED